MVASLAVFVIFIGAMNFQYYCATAARKADVRATAARLGLLLLEIIPLPLRGSDFVQRVGTRAATWGHVGAVVLGMTFALLFCPVSAALFFGGLMPLAMKESSRILLPSLYGIGTGLPVLAVALLAATGFKAIGGVFRELSRVELWARRVTALVFAGVGIYYTLKYILEAFD